MKVGETGRSSGPASVRRAKARSATAETVAAAPRKIADTVSIMGIPEVELTRKVRAAIVTLMAEVDSLRHEIALEVAHGVYAFKPGESVNDALAAADKAMYEQKLASKATGS